MAGRAPGQRLFAEPTCRAVAFHVDLDGGKLTITHGQVVELHVSFLVERTQEWPVYLQFRAFRGRPDGHGPFMKSPANTVIPDAIAGAVVERWLQAVG